MDILRAIVLGIVQGLSEFLPISSSGHLILVPALFKWPDQGLSFDVGLHVGSLVALLAYFARDWVRMFSSGLWDLGSHGLRMRSYRRESQLLWLLALGSVPAAVVGLLFNSWLEENVYHLAVAEDHRQQGIGQRLMADAEQELLSTGARHVFVAVHEENTNGLALVAMMGYEPEGEIVLAKRLATRTE